MTTRGLSRVDRDSRTRPVLRRRAPAFSLLEITLVLVIIGLLLAGAAVAIGPALGRAQERTTRASMETIKQQIEAYRLENKQLPQTLDDLVPGYLEPGKMHDGWERDFFYMPTEPGSQHEYELLSAGKDGEFDTADDLSIWDGIEADQEL